MKSLSLAVLALGASFTLAPPARAEIFILRGGGKIEGILAPSPESPRDRYVIKFPKTGDQLVLSRDQVKEVHKSNTDLKEYQKHRPEFGDTAEEQWQLAEWCNLHKLPTERTLHMERVIQLNPDHAKARAALGYMRDGGDWKTKDEIQSGKGLVKDKTGTWRPPQQIEDLEREKKTKEAEKKWIVNIRRWRGWMDGDRAAEALAELQQIDDPNATTALINYLKNENDVAVRRLYVDALIRLETPDAVHAMGNYAMDDPDDEVRASCLEYLAKANHPGAVDFFIKRLQHKDNVMVNRAGYALGKMKDQRALRPLIDALVTTHKFQVQTGNGNGMNTGFNNGGGGGGFSFGGGGPQIVDVEKQNPDVHSALTALSGVNFDYNKRAWKDWLSSQKKTQNVDARRD
ncbi:MAG TPA: HEAT repeat domain-containing protein [Pirellulales bacterium]|jgi:hypothetical protein